MKMKSSIFVLLLALLIGLKGVAQKTQISKKQLADINELVERLSKEDRFSGTVLVANGKKILYQKAVGFANVESKALNNVNTKFNLASMDKMFTSVAIAQLVENKKLSYSDKITQHLPNLPAATFGKITVEQLLTHTAGTCDIFGIPKFMDIKDTAKTIATYMDLGIKEPLLFEPGTKFAYSNYGYILLGAIIEKLSNMPYFDYVKKNIFDKAGMKNTGSYETDKENTNMAIGYAMPPPMPGQAPPAMGEKVSREPNTKIIEVKGTSAGGGYSTVIDLHKFSMALTSGKLVSPETYALITKGKVVMPAPMLPPNAKPMPEIKYGFGFGELFKNGMRIIGHNGGAPGAEGHLDIYPEQGYTVIILGNYDRIVTPMMMKIEDILTSK